MASLRFPEYKVAGSLIQGQRLVLPSSRCISFFVRELMGTPRLWLNQEAKTKTVASNPSGIAAQSPEGCGGL
jgi:hypothetical protein